MIPAPLAAPAGGRAEGAREGSPETRRMPGRGQGEALPCAARPGSSQTRSGSANCRRSWVSAVPAPPPGLSHRSGGATCRRREAKLSSIHMTRLHASTKTPSSGHLRGCKEFQEGQDVKCHCHTKACKISSPDGSGSTSRSNAIQEFSESFEKQLHFKIKRSVSLQPEGMKERRERARMCMSKSRSHKKEGGKREPKTEQKEEERPEISAGKQS
ncbi:leukemia NUP98 fusion partner 1 isoform X1 [Gopherus evgoodei]|uniref:leukemia NUP98 fusion partner 1 isoform X1 n=1 Tax=Gopherus evgoodei TaxID=1825980 RepID=UPI0011CF3308|nr:leukemia NUP98 fusion partner 1 isoform X1 [Gopherus evgoodei]